MRHDVLKRSGFPFSGNGVFSPGDCEGSPLTTLHAADNQDLAAAKRQVHDLGSIAAGSEEVEKQHAQTRSGCDRPLRDPLQKSGKAREQRS